ncbi:MAG: AAA family ATPase [Acidimicrobiia bacterium]|nr:AAA family ATPase [Acidimicrobiia bacterium]
MVSSFAGVVGHRALVGLLEAEAASPSQAYLFVGPASVGKATLARRFAGLLLCPGADSGCLRRVVAGTHPDLSLVEPDGRTSLTVDQARSTVARAVLAPVEGERKVVLFEEAGVMTDEAASALLKTLEEPSPTTVFILVAEAEHDLPPTVASRCRTIFFGRVTDEEVAAALVERGVDPEQAHHAAVASGGRPGLALMLATQPQVAAFRRAWLSVPGRVGSQPGGAFRLAEELVAAAEPLLDALDQRHRFERDQVEAEGALGRAVKERQERERRRAAAALHTTGLEILASWYRDAAAAQLGAEVRNRDVPPVSLTALTPAAAVSAAGRVLEAVAALHANQRPELAFAALFADLGTAA